MPRRADQGRSRRPPWACSLCTAAAPHSLQHFLVHGCPFDPSTTQPCGPLAAPARQPSCRAPAALPRPSAPRGSLGEARAGRQARHGPPAAQEAGGGSEEEGPGCAGGCDGLPSACPCHDPPLQRARQRLPAKPMRRPLPVLPQRRSGTTRSAPRPAATARRSSPMSRRTRRTTGAVSGGGRRQEGLAACGLAGSPCHAYHAAATCRSVAAAGAACHLVPHPALSPCHMTHSCPLASPPLPSPPPGASPQPRPAPSLPCRRLPPRAGGGKIQGRALHRAAQAGVGPLLHRLDGS